MTHTEKQHPYEWKFPEKATPTHPEVVSDDRPTRRLYDSTGRVLAVVDLGHPVGYRLREDQ